MEFQGIGLKANLLIDTLGIHSSDGERNAIIFLETGKEPVTVSRREFFSLTRSHAQAFMDIGINKGDLLIIAHTQNLESIFLFWGAMLIGAIPSMFPTLTEKLDPEIYARSMAELVRISDVKAIFSTDDFALRMNSIVDCPVIGSSRLKDLANSEPEVQVDPAEIDPSQIAMLQHSSGTTGLQKGVALSHRSVLNQIAHYSKAIGLNKEDVVVSWLPLYHDMGLIAGFILPIFQGVPLVLISPFDWIRHPAMLFRAIHDYQGTLCWLPNFAYNHSARRIRDRDLEGLSLASMRMFINCSEPVYDESHQLFLSRFGDYGLRPDMLAVSYAMAENTFGVTQTAPGGEPEIDVIERSSLENERWARPADKKNEGAMIKVSCGQPIEGTSLRVVDETGSTLPDRRVGEIAVQSDCMLSEYYRRPDLNPFVNGWYMTGDRGYLADGHLYLVGRSKDLIINAGKNVYPQDIEAIVNEIPGIRPGRAVAFGVFDQKEGTELIAVVAEVTTEDAQKRQAIIKKIRLDVAKQSMITVTYVKLVGPKWLIKTSSGKIARGANRDKWLVENSQ
jgi:acyl-CoA synthetase (AMP-forming)/AMP-acid ligase II